MRKFRKKKIYQKHEPGTDSRNMGYGTQSEINIIRHWSIPLLIKYSAFCHNYRVNWGTVDPDKIKEYIANRISGVK